MINRRGLILGLLAAPAIVKAENLMKIVVPKRPKIFVGDYDINSMYGRIMDTNLCKEIVDPAHIEFETIKLRVGKQVIFNPETLQQQLEFFIERRIKDGTYLFERSLTQSPLIQTQDVHALFKPKNLIGAV